MPGHPDSKPGHKGPKAGKHSHWHGTWRPGRVIVVNGRQIVVDDNGNPGDDGPILQGVRNLRINNESGKKLRVFVKFCTSNAGEEEEWLATGTKVYEFDAGETAVLSGKEGDLAASKVRIWAESGEQQWNDFKDRDLVLVEEPYESESLDTFTFTFNK
jgi:hypothetical protein